MFAITPKAKCNRPRGSMTLSRHLISLLILLFFQVQLQSGELRGVVLSAEDGKPIVGARVSVVGSKLGTVTRANGSFLININDSLHTAIVKVQSIGYFDLKDTLIVGKENTIQLLVRSFQSGEVVVRAQKENRFGISAVEPVQGSAIYEAKKTELITLEDITANSATNNARQVFSRVAGLNIWESDQAGLQLGVGGRGLSPNRTAHFNTRQNGYDISADALGYPESYYTPPVEALERIEVIRGAASLQYGTQFGGLLNFVMKRGSDTLPFQAVHRVTGGSFGFVNTFNSLGGTIGDINYYGFYQFKRGDGWRPNSGFNSHTAYAALKYEPTSSFTLGAEYTFFTYTAQQPGGLTDANFDQDPQQSLRRRNWFSVHWNIAAITLDWKITPSLKFNSRTFGVVSDRTAVGNLERINVIDFENKNRTIIRGDFANIGNETRLLWTTELFGNPSNVLVGMRLYSGSTKQAQGDGTNGSDANFSFINPNNLENSLYNNPSRNLALFAEQIIRITPQLNIVPGIRFERIATFSDGWYNNRVFDLAGNLISSTRTDESRSNVRSLLLAGLGVCYHATDDIEIYTNFSQNYRAVNFSDMRVVNPNFQIDQNLTDERGWTSDLGVRGSLKDKLYFDVSFFALRYADRIGLLLRDDEPPLYLPFRYRTNIGSSQTYGIEAFAETDILSYVYDENRISALTMFINASLLKGTYIQSANASIVGKEVELVPPMILRAGVNYRIGGLRVGAQWSYTQRHFTDATNAERTSTAVNGIIPSYNVVDISARYNFSETFAFEASCNNLLDARYFTRRADGYPGPGIIPADARQFYGGVEFRW